MSLWPNVWGWLFGAGCLGLIVETKKTRRMPGLRGEMVRCATATRRQPSIPTQQGALSNSYSPQKGAVSIWSRLIAAHLPEAKRRFAICLHSLLTVQNTEKEKAANPLRINGFHWLREQDLNLRSSGYEPDEIPDFSIPRLDGVLRPGRENSAGGSGLASRNLPP
jgi:hypothetical protein